MVITIFVAGIIKDAVPDMIEGFKDAQEDSKTSPANRHQSMTISVKATDTTTKDSLFNQNSKQQLPYTIQEIKMETTTPLWYKIATGVKIPFVFFALFGFFCLIRMVISVTRGQVFIKKNVILMRLFIYSIILYSAIMEISDYFLYQEWTSQLIIKGYEIADYNTTEPWLEFFILALFTEIFAVGVKMKEEQDLTI